VTENRGARIEWLKFGSFVDTTRKIEISQAESLDSIRERSGTLTLRADLTPTTSVSPVVWSVAGRQGSPTLHSKVEMQFSPSPWRQVVIPPGVAHALDDVGRIFTINRPKFYLDANGSYPAGPGTVSWPLDSVDYPSFPQRTREPPRALIKRFVEDETRSRL